MKFALVLLFVAVASAMPTADLEEGVVPILKSENVRDEFGQYHSEYLSGDGTSVSEQGKLVDGPEGAVIVKSGTIKYTSPEGEEFVLSYVADAEGYRPVANYLPVAPLPQ